MSGFLNSLWILSYRLRGIEVGRASRVSPLASLKLISGGKIKVGRNCRIFRGVLLWTYGGSIEIGDFTSINPYCVLYGHGGLHIGRGVRIAAHTIIIPSNHQIAPDKFIYEQPETKRGIRIEDDVWIGSGARILDGVTIAYGSVIGAGAVVTRPTERFGIYAGIPARRIGDRRGRPGVNFEASGLTQSEDWPTGGSR